MQPIVDPIAPAVAPGHHGIAGWRLGSQAVDDHVQALEDLRLAAQATDHAAVWIHLCPHDAWAAQLQALRTRAAECTDPALRRQRYPLLGVPFAVKDNIDIAGQPTTAACPAFTHTASDNANVVQRLLDAGAVWIGKTNLDQFATGLVGTRSPYGQPASVADPSRISGGSSSGSAVAVARGLAAFSLGTDTAGSGRVPAGLNGLVGLKPTPGRVGNRGVVPACRSLDCVSIFATGVGDAAHVLSVLEGPDPGDPYSHFAPGPTRWPGALRLGVPNRPVFHGDAGYEQAWPRALARARELGHELVDIDFEPLWAVAALLYDGPWVAERHAVVRQLLQTQPGAFDPTVRQVIAKALDFDATAAFEAQYRLRELQQSLGALWQRVDALLVPTTTGHPTFAEVAADPVGANARMGTYTNFVNLLGWSALAVPAGHTDKDLPFGVTFIAPGGCDSALVHAGEAWLGENTHEPPLLRPASTATLDIAVVGAHLSGLPLNGQLVERGAVRVASTTTAPHYRLFALPGTTPPKPGLQRVPDGGAAIAVEVWAMPLSAVGSFLALIPPPLGLGSVELADGRHVHGFICEGHALQGALDVTSFGGWRAYRASLAT